MLEPSDWTIAKLSLAGRQCGIACGTDAEALADPVAVEYRSGSHGPVELLATIAQTAFRPGDRILDLGAHLGGFSVTSAALGCRVLAVEASPRNARLLEMSRRHNGFESLHVENAAIGDAPGTVRFESKGSWGQVADAGSATAVVVPMVTVDDLLAARGWDTVDFVKLDVEGCEVRALHGAARLLERDDAPPFFFESNRPTLAKFGETPESLKAEFVRHGYTIYHVRAGLIAPEQAWERQTKKYVDYLACKRVPDRLAAWCRPSLRALKLRVSMAVKSLLP